jgi:hypothetical protein
VAVDGITLASHSVTTGYKICSQYSDLINPLSFLKVK